MKNEAIYIKRILNETTKWILAIFCSVFVLNILVFAYYHPFCEFKRPGGATPSVMVPYQWGLYGDEGWRIQTIDSFGYPNPNLPRAEKYFCIIGSSHTEGFRSIGKRYSDILNDMLGDGESLIFYNIAHSGFYFDEIAKHFSGIVQEFPDMTGLVVEIHNTDYTVATLTSSLEQIGYDRTTDSAEEIMSKLSNKEKTVIHFKNSIPFFRLLSLQLKRYREYKFLDKDNKSKINEENTKNEKEYREVLDKVFILMREMFNGEIIIVYHPMTNLNVDGTLNVKSNYTDTIFEEVCREHSIVFINMKEDFVKEFYENNHAVYGFNNTTLMTGHINQYCHQLIAERLFNYFEGR